MIEFRISNCTRVVADVIAGRSIFGLADASRSSTRPGLEVAAGPAACRSSTSALCTRSPASVARRSRTSEFLGRPSLSADAQGAFLRRQAVRRLRGILQDRFHPRILAETFQTAKRIVLAGMGIGAAIPRQIERELKDGSCVTLPVDAPWLRLHYGFIFQARPDPVARRQGVHGDRPGDRAGDPSMSDGLA